MCKEMLTSPFIAVQEEVEQKLQRQREMKQDLEDQIALKEIILQATKEEEETFKKAMLAKFAEDDRIELMNAQKQRMKQLEHKRAVEKLIEERRSQFLADKVGKALPFISKHSLGASVRLRVHTCVSVCM